MKGKPTNPYGVGGFKCSSKTSTSITLKWNKEAQQQTIRNLGPYRDELAVSTKAGYDMWQGPYGNWGSRKYLMASLDQSLRRMGLDYVDIFLPSPARSGNAPGRDHGGLKRYGAPGKALYVGISIIMRSRLLRQ